MKLRSTKTLATPGEVKQAMLTKIADSLLDEGDASKLKFKALTANQVSDMDVPVAAAGFVLPYFTIDGKPSNFWRLRYLEDTRKGFDVLNGRKPLRYVQPTGGVNEVYLPPYVDWRKIAENTTMPLVITEGELKAACATKLGMPTIGLGGVYSFKSVKHKEALLPMLREIDWGDRVVYICYDSDAVTNPLVVLAENQLAKTLTEYGAIVRVARIPPGEGGAKVGLDDFLLTHEIDELVALMGQAEVYSVCQALHEMNELVAYVRDPGLIYDFKNKMRLGAQAFTQHAFSHYWHDVVKVLADGSEKFDRKPTALTWLQWKHRNELESVTFEPGHPKIVDRKLNVWDGWPIEPKKGDIKPWKQLLDHLFEGAEPEARKWFEQWCAYPLQNPGTKMAVAAVFWGKMQGSGKTIVGHTLMRIYGRYSEEIKDTQLDDDRNEWAENKQFVLFDDITGHNNRRLQRRLMTLITQKFININRKYVPAYSLPDCINYYFTSNDPDCFYMDDDDRRFFINEVRAGKLDPEFRKRYVEWRDSEAGIAALFHYFLSLDLKGFDPQAEAYVTQAKQEMVSIVKSDLGTWVAELKMNADSRLKLPGDLFTANELLMMYDPMHQGKVTANGMARELKRAGYRAPGTGSMAITKLGNVRLYAIRNAAQWEKATMKQIVAHYEGNRAMEPQKAKGKVKF